MIKLMDLILEVKLSPKEQEQYKKALAILQDETLDEGIKDSLKKLGLSAAVIAALMASPQLSSAQKSIVQDLKGQTTMTAKSERTGTDVDGINGYYTSQFQFPTAFMHDLNSNKILDLGIQGNEVTKIINSTGLSVKQMAEWNNYVKWMISKGFSGNKQMDRIGFSENVLKQYKQENPGFWVKSSDDIKNIQTVLKAYRLYTIASWELGIKQAIKMGFKPVDIQMSGKAMDPSNPEDVKRVESNYMLWAK